jgi:hypothetical protein
MTLGPARRGFVTRAVGWASVVACLLTSAPALAQMQTPPRLMAPCAAPPVFGPMSYCDRARRVLCTAAFGLYMRDVEAEQRRCDALSQLDAMLAQAVASSGNDINSLVANQRFQALRTIASGMNDRATVFWVVLVNTSTQPAHVSLQTLISPTTVGPIGPPNDYNGSSYLPPDWSAAHRSDLINLLAGAPPGAPQPAHAWRAQSVDINPNETVAVAMPPFHPWVAYGTPWGYAVGLFKETAADHPGIDPQEALAVGMYPFFSGYSAPQKRGPG